MGLCKIWNDNNIPDILNILSNKVWGNKMELDRDILLIIKVMLIVLGVLIIHYVAKDFAEMGQVFLLLILLFIIYMYFTRYRRWKHSKKRKGKSGKNYRRP